MLFTASMAPMARFQPQLATPAREPPAGDDWLHEIKLDGYRIGCQIGALLCGTYAPDRRLVFAGKVGTGFSGRQAAELRMKLETLEDAACPFAPPPDAFSRRGALWVRPVLVAEISFAAWTDDAKIRHASFVGLRTDKAAPAVTRENISSAAQT